MEMIKIVLMCLLILLFGMYFGVELLNRMGENGLIIFNIVGLSFLYYLLKPKKPPK